MNTDRQKQIAERRAQIPKCYRGTYDKALRGRSLRAAVTSFCLECVVYATNEVRHCSDTACPLWKVRPYQDVPQNAREGRDIGAESSKSATGRLWAS